MSQSYTNFVVRSSYFHNFLIKHPEVSVILALLFCQHYVKWQLNECENADEDIKYSTMNVILGCTVRLFT